MKLIKRSVAFEQWLPYDGYVAITPEKIRVHAKRCSKSKALIGVELKIPQVIGNLLTLSLEEKPYGWSVDHGDSRFIVKEHIFEKYIIIVVELHEK